ncbi:MAG: GH3 auxin-responsive promoter family protein [Chloroflexota bacterium]
MSKLAELFHQGNYDEVWRRSCGFIDLSPRDFMSIQRRLLAEQLELLKNCELGRIIMKGTDPRSLEEFQKQVPLTTYDDYAPYFLKQRDDVLPGKASLWQYTSGKSGEYPFRWVPVNAQQLEAIEPLIWALVLFSTCKERNLFSIREHDKVLYGMAPPPYATGTMTHAFPYHLFDFMPPVDEAEKATFEDRIKQGFQMSLSEGLDLCFSMSSVAVAIGEHFSEKGRSTSLKELLKNPKALFRLGKGFARSKLAHRNLLPRDLWSPKGLITYGIDGTVYREKIREMWGTYPLDFHGCTEAVIIAMQTWDHQGMTFVPNLNLFEFIPEEESLKSYQDPSYQPSTLLIDNVTPGNYELVITSFHGGPFIRYRLGHLVRITSLKNEALNINLPQMTFLTRIDDQIDIAGFTRLSEKIIWQALENSGTPYVNWTARKEVEADKPVLRLYVELKDGNGISAEGISHAVHEELKKLDAPYAELESFTGLKPLEVTLLQEGAFRCYRQNRENAGADLSSRLPPHLNPSQEMLDMLIRATPEREMGVREEVPV